jgi:arsenate reductase-like glutaredoxin family protein
VIDDMIKSNTVAIFSKTYCPYCKRIKEFFASKSIEFQALELDIMGQQGKDIQALILFFNKFARSWGANQ